MKKIMTVLLILILVGCNQQTTTRPEIIHMVVSTDIHMVSPELIENKSLYDDLSLNYGDGRQLNYSAELLTIFIQQMILEKPEFVILTGDLTLEGEKLSHQWLASQLQQLTLAGIQPLVIPGNHDILNPASRTFGTPSTFTPTITSDDFADIYKKYGYEDALYRDEHSLSYVYSLRDNAWILMLDTSQYVDNTQLGAVGSGKLQTETFEWIEEIGALAREKGVQLLSSTHHNLIKQNPMFGSDYTLLNTLKAIRIFDEQDIRVNLSGHIHAQSITQTTHLNKPITDICTSSLLVYTNQYGDIYYEPFKEFNYSTKELNVEGWAKENSTNEDFINFETYSKDYFSKSSTSRISDRFKYANYTDEQNKQLTDAKGYLNAIYFSGNIHEIRDEFLQTEFYAWLIQQDETTRSYILSMLRDTTINQKEITINMSK